MAYEEVVIDALKRRKETEKKNKILQTKYQVERKKEDFPNTHTKQQFFQLNG